MSQAGLSNPPLTTVAQDAGLARRTPVETLLARIGGEATRSLVLPPARLVMGRSSGV